MRNTDRNTGTCLNLRYPRSGPAGLAGHPRPANTAAHVIPHIVEHLNVSAALRRTSGVLLHSNADLVLRLLWCSNLSRSFPWKSGNITSNERLQFFGIATRNLLSFHLNSLCAFCWSNVSINAYHKHLMVIVFIYEFVPPGSGMEKLISYSWEFRMAAIEVRLVETNRIFCVLTEAFFRIAASEAHGVPMNSAAVFVFWNIMQRPPVIRF